MTLLTLALILSFSLTSAAVNLTSPFYYFDFEDMPVSYNAVYCGASYTGCTYPFISNGSRDGSPLQAQDFRVALNSTNPQTTFNKVGNWAWESYDLETGIGANAYPNFYSLMNGPSSPSPVTYAFWVYIGSDDGISTPIFHDGVRQGYSGDSGFMVVVNDDGDIIIDGDCTDNKYVWGDTNITKDTWYHLVIGGTGGVSLTHNDIATDGGVFINGNPVNMVMYNITDNFKGWSVAPYAHLRFGDVDVYSTNKSLCYDTWLNATMPNATTDFVYMELDDFAAYQAQFNQSDAQTLYNNGYGYNPFSPLPPTVHTEPTNPISLDNSDSLQIDYLDYFNGATSYFIYYYDIWTGVWNVTELPSPQSINVSGNVLVVLSYLDDDSFMIFSYDYDNAVMMRLMGCNPSGCTNTTSFTVTVGGSFVDTGEGVTYPYVNTQPDDRVIETGDWERYVYSDYYNNLDTTPEFRTYIYNIADDDSFTVLTVGGNHNFDSCLNYTATLQSVIFTAIASGCEYRVLFVYADDYSESPLSSFVYTQQFSLRMIAPDSESNVAQKEGITGDGVAAGVLRLFPSEPSNTTALMIVLITLLAVILGAGLVAYQGSGVIGAITGGVGTMVVIIFFTVIGYIPVWLLAIIMLGALMIGIGFFRSGIMGGGI